MFYIIGVMYSLLFTIHQLAEIVHESTITQILNLKTKNQYLWPDTRGIS